MPLSIGVGVHTVGVGGGGGERGNFLFLSGERLLCQV